ncbi:MAG: signal peptidase I [Planctomycetales bacterium]|nr:signal peptidase I [Planctomycetales bacterium]
MNLSRLGVLAQQGGGDAAAAAGGALIVLFVQLVVIEALYALMWWKMFEKAGKPGWASLVPIYNVIVLLEIAGKPIWWIVLLMIPCVGFVVAILVFIEIAKSFGKGTGFAIGLILLGIVFFPILGFGDAKYLGPQKS